VYPTASQPALQTKHSAATDDAAAADLWRVGKTGHRRDCERITRAVLGRTTGPAPRALTATLYVLIGPETYTVLVDQLGFTSRAYEQWLREQLTIVFRAAKR